MPRPPRQPRGRGGSICAPHKALNSRKRAQVRYRAAVTSPKSTRDPGSLVPLRNRQIDITTRMGALTAATPTGLRTLDDLMGGLRNGTLFLLGSAPGDGKTALSLFLSYMAARSGAAVLYASASLDETEVMARLAARALHRDWPDANTPYGRIWSGHAWQAAATRGPVAQAVETVVSKVGTRLHLHSAAPFEPIERVGEQVAQLWGRHERVVLVVDDIESFSADGAGSAESMQGRIARVAYVLRGLADQGCAVIATSLLSHWESALTAATQAGYLAAPPIDVGLPVNAPPALGVRALDLTLEKNRLGATGSVPLWFVAGAALFQERA